jgi:hypothetical protein
LILTENLLPVHCKGKLLNTAYEKYSYFWESRESNKMHSVGTMQGSFNVQAGGTYNYHILVSPQTRNI